MLAPAWLALIQEYDALYLTTGAPPHAGAGISRSSPYLLSGTLSLSASKQRSSGMPTAWQLISHTCWRRDFTLLSLFAQRDPIAERLKVALLWDAHRLAAQLPQPALLLLIQGGGTALRHGTSGEVAPGLA
jgi:hypothetical protein